MCLLLYFLKVFICLFLEGGREGEREGNINVWLSLERPLLETQATTQPCTLTGNQTGDPLVRSPVLNPLSHTSQGPNAVSYTHLTLPTIHVLCRSRWSPYH